MGCDIEYCLKIRNYILLWKFIKIYIIYWLNMMIINDII